MTQKDKKLILAELFNRCWDDEAYKAQFVDNPAKILAEAGFPVDAGKTYRVVENSADAQYIVLPEKDAAAVFEQFKALAAQKEPFIPAGKEIRFVQNSDAAQYIILPHKPADKLTDEQLDAVAGGTSVALADVLSEVVFNFNVNTQMNIFAMPYANTAAIVIVNAKVAAVVVIV